MTDIVGSKHMVKASAIQEIFNPFEEQAADQEQASALLTAIFNNTKAVLTPLSREYLSTLPEDEQEIYARLSEAKTNADNSKILNRLRTQIETLLGDKPTAEKLSLLGSFISLQSE